MRPEAARGMPAPPNDSLQRLREILIRYLPGAMQPEQDREGLRNIALRFVAGSPRLGDTVADPEISLVEAFLLARIRDV